MYGARHECIGLAAAQCCNASPYGRMPPGRMGNGLSWRSRPQGGLAVPGRWAPSVLASTWCWRTPHSRHEPSAKSDVELPTISLPSPSRSLISAPSAGRLSRLAVQIPGSRPELSTGTTPPPAEALEASMCPGDWRSRFHPVGAARYRWT